MAYDSLRPLRPSPRVGIHYFMPIAAIGVEFFAYNFPVRHASIWLVPVFGHSMWDRRCPRTGINPGGHMRPDELLQEPARCESPWRFKSGRLHDSVRLEVEGLKRREI